MPSRKRTSSKDLGTQVSSGNSPCSHVLESRPVFSFNLDLLAQPFRNGLLREGGTIEEVGEAFGKRNLATGDFNGPLQRSNVRFIHDHPRYTTMVVSVNNHGRVPTYNEGCTVVPMADRRPKLKQAPSKPARVRQAAQGPDGLTFGDRLKACMVQRARQLGVATDKYTQKMLIREATQAVGRDPNQEENWVLTQQGLSLILRNQISESPAAIAFAMALGVEPAWLQYGIGPPNFAQRLLAKS